MELNRAMNSYCAPPSSPGAHSKSNIPNHTYDSIMELIRMIWNLLLDWIAERDMNIIRVII